MTNLLNKLIEKNRWVLLLLAVSVVVCYIWILPAPFKTVDDYISIINNPHIKHVSGLMKILTGSFFDSGSYYRPMVYISFMVEHMIFGLNPIGYYLTNILLHILNAFLAFLIIDRLSSDRWLGFVSALLFSVHPLHWEAICNIPGRSIILCATFFFIAFYAFLLYMGSKERDLRLFSTVLIAFILSLLSKESAVILPFMFVVWGAIYRKNLKGVLGRFMTVSGTSFMVLAGYMLMRRKLGITNMNHWEDAAGMFLGVTTFLKSSIAHLISIIFPVNLYFDRSEAILTQTSDLWVAASWMFWVIVLLLIVFGFKRRNKVFDLSCWWVVLNMGLVSQIVPIVVAPGHISAADHFLYIPSVGIFTALIICTRIIFGRLRQAKYVSLKVLRFAAVGYFVFLFSMTVNLAISSTNQITMYKETLRNNPANTRIRNALATAYAHAKMYSEAEGHYAGVLEREPWNTDARIGYGVALCDKGECAKALLEYDKIRGEVKKPKLLEHNRNVALARLVHQYQQRLKTDGATVALHHSLGVVYSRQGRIDEAIAQYELALNLDPKHAHTLFNLASLKDAIGRKEYASGLYQRYISSPDAEEELVSQAKARIAAIQEQLPAN